MSAGAIIVGLLVVALIIFLGVWFGYVIPKRKADAAAAEPAAGADAGAVGADAAGAAGADAGAADTPEEAAAAATAAAAAVDTSRPTPAECTSYFAIDEARGCLRTDGTAGIKWMWDVSGVDGIGAKCRALTNTYTVNAVSSYDPTMELQKIVKNGSSTSAGFGDAPPRLTNGQTVTFNVMPLDAAGTPVITAPVESTIDKTAKSTSCGGDGVVIYPLAPDWNKKGKFIGAQLYLTGGLKNVAIASVYNSVITTNKDGLKLTYLGEGKNKYVKYKKDYRIIVPEGGKLKVDCGAGKKNHEFTYDNMLKRLKPDQNIIDNEFYSKITCDNRVGFSDSKFINYSKNDLNWRGKK